MDGEKRRQYGAIVRPYMVVDPRRDHSFRIPRPDLSERIGTPNACNDCHAEKSPAWASSQIRRWYGPQRSGTFHYGEAIHAGRTSRPGAERLLTRVADDVEMAAIVRATALSLLPPYFGPGSLPTVERALLDGDPLVRVGALRAMEVLLPAETLRLAYPLLEDPVRYVRLEAARLLAALPQEIVPRSRQGAIEAGIEAYREAQQFNAERAESHLNLGSLHMQRGEMQQAEASFRKAIRLQPRFIPAYLNLADLFRAQGREEEGEKTLREALTLEPESGDVHHALGLLLVRGKRLPEAMAALKSAVDLAPSAPHYAYVYGVALEGVEGVGRAVEELERAQKAHPADRRILSTLVVYNEQRGDFDAASRWAKRLVEESPDDPRWRRLAERIESRRIRP